MESAISDIREGMIMVRNRVIEVLPSYHENFKLRVRLKSIEQLLENKNLIIFLGVSEIILLFVSWKVVALMMIIHFAALWPVKWTMQSKQTEVLNAATDLKALYGIELTLVEIDVLMHSPDPVDEFDI